MWGGGVSLQTLRVKDLPSSLPGDPAEGCPGGRVDKARRAGSCRRAAGQQDAGDRGEGCPKLW